jgi:hypothetical protein
MMHRKPTAPGILHVDASSDAASRLGFLRPCCIARRITALRGVTSTKSRVGMKAFVTICLIRLVAAHSDPVPAWGLAHRQNSPARLNAPQFDMLIFPCPRVRMDLIRSVRAGVAVCITSRCNTYPPPVRRVLVIMPPMPFSNTH